MKIYSINFYFTGSKEVVPFDYTNLLLSFLHNKILGAKSEIIKNCISVRKNIMDNLNIEINDNNNVFGIYRLLLNDRYSSEFGLYDQLL